MSQARAESLPARRRSRVIDRCWSVSRDHHQHCLEGLRAGLLSVREGYLGLASRPDGDALLVEACAQASARLLARHVDRTMLRARRPREGRPDPTSSHERLVDAIAGCVMAVFRVVRQRHLRRVAPAPAAWALVSMLRVALLVVLRGRKPDVVSSAFQLELDDLLGLPPGATAPMLR